MFEHEMPGKKKQELPKIKSINFQACICRIRTLVDGGIKCELELGESEPVLIGALYALRNQVLDIGISLTNNPKTQG